MNSEFRDIKHYSLPPEEAQKIIRDYEKFKHNQVENPVSEFVKNALEEFHALLNSTTYDFAVKQTKHYIEEFKKLVDNGLIIETKDLIADLVLKAKNMDELKKLGVEILMYTEEINDNTLTSLIILKVRHSIHYDARIEVGNRIIITNKGIIPIGLYAVLISKNLNTGKTSKKAFFLLG